MNYECPNCKQIHDLTHRVTSDVIWCTNCDHFLRVDWEQASPLLATEQVANARHLLNDTDLGEQIQQMRARWASWGK